MHVNNNNNNIQHSRHAVQKSLFWARYETCFGANVPLYLIFSLARREQAVYCFHKSTSFHGWSAGCSVCAVCSLLTRYYVSLIKYMIARVLYKARREQTVRCFHEFTHFYGWSEECSVCALHVLCLPNITFL